MIRIRCLVPPLQNIREGVKLWHAGDEADIAEITGFWQGMIEQGIVELVSEPEPEPVVEKPAKPPRGSKRGKKDGKR